MTERHHILCEWHLDQYPQECTCGVSRPKAEWFDEQVKIYEELMATRDVIIKEQLNGGEDK